MSSASGTWPVFCCCFNEGYDSGELRLPICWKEVINKHTKGEEKGSFQAFLREEKRERAEEWRTRDKHKKKNLSLVSLPDDDTRLQTHHEEDEEEDEEQQTTRGREEEEEDDPGRAPRGTGRRGHGTARHGTGERPANGLGRQWDLWILFFFLPEFPFSSSRQASELLLPPRELQVPLAPTPYWPFFFTN